MTRSSAWRGTWRQNRRPFVTMAPDAYVAIQGETSVIGCGECRRQVNINDYVTSISTEANVESAPGSATVQLTIPDNDINQFYSDGQLIIIPMMEIELYSKGYFLIGGFPQYYKIFWGIISSVTKSWSNGSTTISISCKDILRWWELTNTITNPAFLNPIGTSAGGYQLFQNQFAGLNPYTVIIHLAREAMGDFSFTTGSFLSFTPEVGNEGGAAGNNLKDIMLYWQLKFGKIWNSLVLYGSSGQIYTTEGFGGTVSPVALSKTIFDQEFEFEKDKTEANALLKISPGEIAAFKIEIQKAGDVEFFQNESQTKLSLANQAKEQISYEFYCDPSGDIVFKPPFYNLNVLPNKPVSWIQDFEIIDDSVTDSEAEVFTHITSAGNAFGGVTDWGLNDEITTPRTGVFDYHLLRRYGWRKFDYQCEWAGNPKKLFYHLMDMLDRLNAKRQNGTVTIPLRPEIKMGFPIWFPKYDSFFYVSGVSHSYSVGGQATTTLTLVAKRSKFIAPNNIGRIEVSGTKSIDVTSVGKPVPVPSGKANTQVKTQTVKTQKTYKTYRITFPDNAGDTSGSSNYQSQGKNLELRDPKTGKLLGYPNVVMVYRSTTSGESLARVIESFGQPVAAGKNKTQTGSSGAGSPNYGKIVSEVFKYVANATKDQLISRIRLHRYETASTNAGVYDYAHDVNREFKEFQIIPVDAVTWGSGDGAVNSSPSSIKGNKKGSKAPDQSQAAQEVLDNEKKLIELRKAAQKKVDDIVKGPLKQASKLYEKQQKLYSEAVKKDQALLKKEKPPNTSLGKSFEPVIQASQAAQPSRITFFLKAEMEFRKEAFDKITAELNEAKLEVAKISARIGRKKVIPNLNMIVRPVSDDFGFEVIGHYKYGRGSFIDRGKLQLPSPSSDNTSNDSINKINIQFSPTGGLLTEGVETSEQSAYDFSKLFETMRPEDWATGAHFKGSTSNGTDKPSDYLITSQSTYTSDIQQSVGKSVFIEADSTRRAITLSEMKPTVDIHGLSGAVDDCNACGMSHSDWLGILPLSVIKEILSESGKADAASRGDAVPSTASASSEKFAFQKSVKVDNPFEPPFSTTPYTYQSPRGPTEEIIQGAFDSGSFFKRLNLYLGDEFSRQIKSNDIREKAYSGEALGKINPFDSDFGETDNILTPPGGALFDRASNGDVQALQALQNQANFNFGQTKDAAKNLKDQYNQGANIVNTLGEFAEQSGPVFVATAGAVATGGTSLLVTDSSLTTGDPKKQGQLLPKPDPNFQGVINPDRFGSANSYMPPSPIDPASKEGQENLPKPLPGCFHGVEKCDFAFLSVHQISHDLI